LKPKLQSFQSPDELFGFFNEELDDLWATGRVERGSLLGLFLRKMICSFNDRTFHFISRLFEQLSSYTSNEEGGYRGFISSAQYESFISNEAANIEDSIGTVSREQIQKNIDELNHLVPNMFGAPYLSYLNALSYGDVESAVDNLHKYYDLIFLLKGGSSSTNVKRPNQPNQPPKLPDLLPYAVLNLASLHFKFRHYHEGLQAILETVKIAQQKSDDECLAHALSWLYRIVAASMDVDQSNKEMMLKRAVGRAQELNLPSLAASNSLALAEHYLHHTHGIVLPGASPIEASRTVG
jgi:anaphase-promoting complex subunit 5